MAGAERWGVESRMGRGNENRGGVFVWEVAKGQHPQGRKSPDSWQGCRKAGLVWGRTANGDEVKRIGRGKFETATLYFSPPPPKKK